MCSDWTETCTVACITFLLYKDKISAKLNRSRFTYMLSTQTKCKGRPFMCEATIDGRQICVCTHALLWRWLVSATLQPLYPRKKTSCPMNRRAGWASPSVCLGPRNLAPTPFRAPEFPARTQSSYRLRYSGTHT